MEHVPLLSAFAAGFLSFITPCVLPLVPGYVAYVSGASLDGGRGGLTPAESGRTRRRVLAGSVAFIIGFSVVFIVIGASATSAGQFLLGRQVLFGRLAGSLVILIGFHTLGVLRLDRLMTDRRAQAAGPVMPAGLAWALLVGAAFAFGWTPCIGPILTAILFVGSDRETVGRGVVLLGVYSGGLAVPFLVTAAAVERLAVRIGSVRRRERALAAGSGALLILLGALIFTGRVTVIAQFLTRYLPVF